MLATLTLALAAAVVVQDSGPNQAAHFALVRALASGRAEIDPRETIDASYVAGRYYAAKAPGLAMFTLPWYGALRAVGLQDARLTGEGYGRRVWELNLFGAVLPALVLFILMTIAVERVAPGYGFPTGILLITGSLLLGFATLFFDHLLAATLGFGAFVVLLGERERRNGRWRLAAAGFLAGLAVVVEFPLALVGLVLAVYSAAGPAPVRRGGTYAAGVAVGLLPLVAYNTWAFGSPTTLSYTNALKAPSGSGAPVVGANDEGFYGVGLVDPRAALSLVFSEKGLAIVAPLAIVALAGLPLLWRAGRRAEALVCGAVPLLVLAYNAAYYLPWGGQGPGPRFLVPALPFLALPLALALRAWPLVVFGIALVSVAVTALITITDPLTGEEHGLGASWDLLRTSVLVDTVPTRLGVDSPWLGVLPFVLALGLGLVLSLSRLPVRGRARKELPVLAGALVAWALIVLVGPRLLPADEGSGTLEGALAAAVLAATLAAALALAVRRGPLALLPALPLVVAAAPTLADRPRWALLWIGLTSLLAAAVWARAPMLRRSSRQVVRAG